MVIFLNAVGDAQIITPQSVYQGSDAVTDITVIAPFSAATQLSIGFVLPTGLYYTNADGATYLPMMFIEQDFTSKANVWKFKLERPITEMAGEVQIAINAVYMDGVTQKANCTSYQCKFTVTESILPALPTAPSKSVYDYLAQYVGELNMRTLNYPSLVATIEKTAPNAFRAVTFNGTKQAEIVLENDLGTPPTPLGAASSVYLDSSVNTAESSGTWTPIYNDTTVTGYQTTITAAQHTQMRDGANARDLWVGFDTVSDATISGAYQGYTVNESGDITITVTTPVAMTVRVWNGKGVVDVTAREAIAAETNRAEAVEKNMWEHIEDIEQSGVDLKAREQIASEAQRAKAEEAELQKSKADLSGATFTGNIQSPNVIAKKSIYCDSILNANDQIVFQQQKRAYIMNFGNTDNELRFYGKDPRITYEYNELAFDESDNSTGQPTGNTLTKELAYVDDFKNKTIPYDLVVTTQEEFETFYLSLDANTCAAKSVLLRGDNGAFYRSDGKGLKLPSTLYQLDGANNAIIEVTNFEYNATTNRAAVWYKTLPTDGNYSISNLTVKCEAPSSLGVNVVRDAYGFCNCTNLTNCVSNAIGNGYRQTLPAVRSYGYGFYQCAYLVNCVGTGTSANSFGGGSGFFKCTYEAVTITELEKLILNMEYPLFVERPYIQFRGMKTPAERWAGTTWEIDTKYQGRVLIGSGGNYELGSTGGSPDAVVVQHRGHILHTDSSSDPTDEDTYFLNKSYVTQFGNTRPYVLRAGNEAILRDFYEGESGVGKNMPPYVVVNYWRRLS